MPLPTSAQKARLALLPLVPLVGLATLAGVLQVVAFIRGETVRDLVEAAGWLLFPIVVPALLFGMVLGMILDKIIAYFSPLRKLFDRECDKPGRPDFQTATSAQFFAAAFFLTLTVLALMIFAFVTRD